MTREDQLVFCEQCTNRKMDASHGLICKITNRQADFIDECENYELDKEVERVSEEAEELKHVEMLANLSDETVDMLTSEQNFKMALISGVSVGIVGAILWGVITVVTNYQIGYMAIAIGAGIGYTMRYFGKGIDQKFGIAGAVIAVLSCVLGNFLSIIGFVADSQGLGYMDTLSMFDYSQLIPIMTETFGIMDLVFYGFAAYEGYKFAFRVITEKELSRMSGSSSV